MTPRDSIGPASVRSAGYYLLAELFERAELDELLDAQTGVLLGIALGDLLREGWTILAPPPKADITAPIASREFDLAVADAILGHREERRARIERAEAEANHNDCPEYADVATELRRVFKRKPA